MGDKLLDSIITCDETWVLFENAKSHLQSKSWCSKGQPGRAESRPKPFGRKVMATLWFDRFGLLLLEFMPDNTTLTAISYSMMLEKVRTILKNRRPGKLRSGVRVLHDKARIHVAKITQTRLMAYGWKNLPHPPYSPCLSPCDFNAFPELKVFLQGKCFTSRDALVQATEKFFQSKGKDWYRQGIDALTERWRKCVRVDGAYFEHMTLADSDDDASDDDGVDL